MVLVPVRLARCQVVQLNPKGFAIAHSVHHAGLTEAPAVEVAHHEDEVLERSRPLKDHRVVVDVVDAVHNARRWCDHGRRLGHHKHRGFRRGRGAVQRRGDVQEVVSRGVQEKVVVQCGAKGRGHFDSVDRQREVRVLRGLGHNWKGRAQSLEGGSSAGACEGHFERSVGHVIENVAFVRRFAHRRAVGIAEHKRELFDGHALGDTIVFRQTDSAKVKAVDGALHGEKGVAVVGLAGVVPIGPWVLDVLPVRGRCAFRRDDPCVCEHEGARRARGLFVQQGGVALADVVVQRDHIVLCGEGRFSPNDLRLNGGGAQQGNQEKEGSESHGS